VCASRRSSYRVENRVMIFFSFPCKKHTHNSRRRRRRYDILIIFNNNNMNTGTYYALRVYSNNSSNNNNNNNITVCSRARVCVYYYAQEINKIERETDRAGEVSSAAITSTSHAVNFFSRYYTRVRLVCAGSRALEPVNALVCI